MDEDSSPVEVFSRFDGQVFMQSVYVSNQGPNVWRDYSVLDIFTYVISLNLIFKMTIIW